MSFFWSESILNFIALNSFFFKQALYFTESIQRIGVKCLAGENRMALKLKEQATHVGLLFK